jgi:hypothetical protein
MRFTIRDLFWLVVVVGMGLGWLSSTLSLFRVDSRRSLATMKEMQYRVDEIYRLRMAIEKAGFKVNHTTDQDGRYITVSLERASE